MKKEVTTFIWILLAYAAIVIMITLFVSCESYRLWEIPEEYDCYVVHNPRPIHTFLADKCSCGDHYVIDHGDWMSVGIDGYKVTELISFIDQERQTQFPEWMPCKEELQFRPLDSREAFILYLNVESE